MRINTNVSSLTAQDAGSNVNKRITSSLEKLGSGLKINKAADDGAGLAISDKLRTQASSIKQGISNGNSAAALIQIADKAMGEQSNILDVVKTKLIQASTATTNADGREAIRKDISKLLEQFDSIASQTNYNGTTLLQKSDTNTAVADTLSFQLGEDFTFDINLNVNYASNTSGMGGGADSLGDGATHTALQDTEFRAFANNAGANDTLLFTNAESTDKLTLSGKLGTLNATDTIVVVGNDDATRALLDAAATASTSVVKNGTGDSATYTFDIATNMEFGDAVANITVNTHTDAKTFKVDSSEAINVKVDNLTVAGNVVLSTVSTAAGSLTGGNLLSGLKGLKADELTATEANNYMTTIDEALTQLNTLRADFGSSQTQIESSIRNMQTTRTNLKNAESVIRDVDYAEESANFNKTNIIAQAGTYAISQANNVQQNILKLLQ